EGVDYEIDYGRGYIRTIAGGALDAAGGTVNVAFSHYQKQNFDDGGVVNREIEEDILVKINISASEVFYDQASDEDVVGFILDFIDSLEKNNGTGISDAINDIDTMLTNLLAAQSSIGAKVNRFELTRTRNENTNIETTRLQSEIEDIDYADVATQFSIQQNIFTASLQAGARVIMPNLGDFLG
ncbi:MAG: flagellin, partial [Elusimicrobiota bacterium]